MKRASESPPRDISKVGEVCELSAGSLCRFCVCFRITKLISPLEQRHRRSSPKREDDDYVPYVPLKERRKIEVSE